VKSGSAPLLGRNVNRALKAIENRSNNIHADATAGDFRDFGGGAEARFENEIQSFLFGQALRLFELQNALLDSTSAQERKIHAAAIVANFDDYLSALMKSIEIDSAAVGFGGS